MFFCWGKCEVVRIFFFARLKHDGSLSSPWRASELAPHPIYGRAASIYYLLVSYYGRAGFCGAGCSHLLCRGRGRVPWAPFSSDRAVSLSHKIMASRTFWGFLGKAESVLDTKSLIFFNENFL